MMLCRAEIEVMKNWWDSGGPEAHAFLIGENIIQLKLSRNDVARWVLRDRTPLHSAHGEVCSMTTISKSHSRKEQCVTNTNRGGYSVVKDGLDSWRFLIDTPWDIGLFFGMPSNLLLGCYDMIKC